MAWYAYCIAEKQAFPEVDHHRKPIPLQQMTGVYGRPVYLYPASDFAMIVSEHEGELHPKAAVEHARVISGCFQMATVLPFRFGTIFADDAALRRSVRSNQRQFTANVERLRGKAEMHLKVVLNDVCPETPKYADAACAGREYLTRLRETACVQRDRQSVARSICMQMHRMFAPLEEEITCRRNETGRMQLDIAHLIDHRSVARYQNKYSSASQALHACSLALAGPLAPYHFVQSAVRASASASHAHA